MHAVARDHLDYESDFVATWKAREVHSTITKTFQEQPADGDADMDLGDTKYRGPADATSDALETGEAKENLPYVSLPDTEMEGCGDKMALAAVAAEKQLVMKDTAKRNAKHEASSGHNLRDTIGDGLLKDQAREWQANIKSLAKLSAAGVTQRCDEALRQFAKVAPSLQ